MIGAAKKLGGKVVLGGHSLGGSVVTAYATWDFDGHAGADDLAGPGLHRRRQRPDPGERPGGDPGTAGARRPQRLPVALLRRDRRALRRPVQRHRVGRGAPRPERTVAGSDLGPAARRHRAAGAGHQRRPVRLRAQRRDVTAEPDRGPGTPRPGPRRPPGPVHGWNGTGALTPIKRFATMFSGCRRSKNADGTEWYFPQRLTDDTGAVGQRQRQPGPERARRRRHHGPRPPEEPADLRLRRPPRRSRRASTDAQLLAQQSGIPASNLTLVNHQSTYAHNDPAGAYPNNVFFDRLVPFLGRVGGRR